MYGGRDWRAARGGNAARDASCGGLSDGRWRSLGRLWVEPLSAAPRSRERESAGRAKGARGARVRGVGVWGGGSERRERAALETGCVRVHACCDGLYPPADESGIPGVASCPLIVLRRPAAAVLCTGAFLLPLWTQPLPDLTCRVLRSSRRRALSWRVTTATLAPR